MRALRVIGLHEDGKSIVCEDPAHRERFLLPADERLRAAARGDVTRLGQIEIELESQMRPREIQARIRAGESVEQVADSAGASVQRIERYAYPVLLERSRMAELAQQAHPIREDGPDVRTLTEVVAYAFGVRGQDYSRAGWDSWKGDDGKWVVALRWQTGRSDMCAHWQFAPGAHGGTVASLDEHADDLLDPNRAPRGLRAVEAEAAAAAQPEPPAEPEPAVEEPAEQAEPVAEIAEPEQAATGTEPGQPAHHSQPTHQGQPGHPSQPGPPARQGQPTHQGQPGAPARQGQPTRQGQPAAHGQQALPGSPAAAKPAKPKSKKTHPAVPAWEDVLLGVRSQRG